MHVQYIPSCHDINALMLHGFVTRRRRSIGYGSRHAVGEGSKGWPFASSLKREVGIQRTARLWQIRGLGYRVRASQRRSAVDVCMCGVLLVILTVLYVCTVCTVHTYLQYIRDSRLDVDGITLIWIFAFESRVSNLIRYLNLSLKSSCCSLSTHGGFASASVSAISIIIVPCGPSQSDLSSVATKEKKKREETLILTLGSTATTPHVNYSMSFDSITPSAADAASHRPLVQSSCQLLFLPCCSAIAAPSTTADALGAEGQAPWI
jgi:hypothetical protein